MFVLLSIGTGRIRILHKPIFYFLLLFAHLLIFMGLYYVESTRLKCILLTICDLLQKFIIKKKIVKPKYNKNKIKLIVFFLIYIYGSELFICL